MIMQKVVQTVIRETYNRSVPTNTADQNRCSGLEGRDK